MRMLVGCLVLASLAAAPPSPGLFQQAMPLKVDVDYITSMAFSPDGKRLAAGYRGIDQVRAREWGEVRLWNLETGKPDGTWLGHQQSPCCLAFSPDGKTLVSVTSSRERIHWNVVTGKAVQTHRESKGGSFHQVVFSKDGKRIAMFDGDHTVVCDASTGRELFRHSRKFRGYGCVFTDDLSLQAVPHHQDVDLYDGRTGKLVRSLLDHRGKVQSVSFSAGGKLLAVLCTRRINAREDVSEIWLWDVPGGRRKQVIELGKMACHQVGLAPGGDRLALVGSDFLYGPAQLRLFDTASGAELGRLQPAPAVQWLVSVTFLPNGDLLATAKEGESLRVWRSRGSDKKGRTGKASLPGRRD